MYQEQMYPDVKIFSLPHGVGETPLLPLSAMIDDKNGQVKLWGKCEMFNIGGSSKARAASYMIGKAIAGGHLNAGQEILLPTSGNTGVACASECAKRGLKLTLVMPENASKKNIDIATHFGAECILTSAELGSDGAYTHALDMQRQQPKLYKLIDQYKNPFNWLAHYRTTGPEIWEQTHGQITHFIAGVGTGGTIIGISRYLKKINPRICTIGVEPMTGERIPGLRNLQTQMIPAIYDSRYVDATFYVSGYEAWQQSSACARQNGLGIGLSGGAALFAGIHIASQVSHGCVVVLIPDGIEKYLS